MGELERAKDFSERALSLSQKIGDQAGEAKAFGNLGVIYRMLGDPIQALTYYQRQLDIVREHGDRFGEGTSRYNLAIALHAASDQDSAVAEMRHASEILQAVHSPLAEQARAWLANAGAGFESMNTSQEVKQGDFEALRHLAHLSKSPMTC